MLWLSLQKSGISSQNELTFPLSCFNEEEKKPNKASPRKKARKYRFPVEVVVGRLVGVGNWLEMGKNGMGSAIANKQDWGNVQLSPYFLIELIIQ